MHATVLDAAPIPLRRPTATLTPKGHAVLALIHEQDALDARRYRQSGPARPGHR